MQPDLTSLSSHFAFGENWANYAPKVDEFRIAAAGAGLARLLEPQEVSGRSVIDIGCGSGVHALAFLRMGARHVTAVDIDPLSVATTRSILGAHACDGAYEVRELSILNANSQGIGRHEIVYSWGVLHHTGAMLTAISRAADLVEPGGLFVFALYRRTLLCPVWSRIKRWYTKADPAAQRRARDLYGWLYRVRHLMTGRDFKAFLEQYKSNRGMDFWHDVHDWVGGYPYESITPPEVDKLLQPHGFHLVRSLISRSAVGLLGSGCDEYVYRRQG